MMDVTNVEISSDTSASSVYCLDKSASEVRFTNTKQLTNKVGGGEGTGETNYTLEIPPQGCQPD